MLQPMSGFSQAVVRGGEYREFQESAPPLYKPEVEPANRKRIIQMLETCQVMNLTTVARNGWPLTSSVAYVTLADEEDRPVFYVFVALHSQEAVNAAGSPKASLAIDINQEPERHRNAQAVQIQAVVEEVGDDDDQWSAGITAMRAKHPALAEGFTKSTHTIIRIDALSIWNYDVKLKPQQGLIDYYAEK